MGSPKNWSAIWLSPACDAEGDDGRTWARVAPEDACPDCGEPWVRYVLAEAMVMSEWQPIETAPKDGTKFDAWIPDAFGGRRMCDLSFNRQGQLRHHGLLAKADLPRWPTHWMPLPAPPEVQP